MRLIDADELGYDEIEDIHDDVYLVVHAPEIDDAPTVKVINKDELLEKLYDKSDTTTDPRNTYQDMVYVRLEDVKRILEEYEVRQDECND